MRFAPSPTAVSRSSARLALGALGGSILLGALAVGAARSEAKPVRAARARWLGGVLLGDDGVVFQRGRTDCGPVVLRMALQRLGLEVGADGDTDGAGGPWGASFDEIVLRAKERGAVPRRWPANADGLRNASLPAVVLLGTHFVLVEARQSPSELIVIDPSIGRYRVSESRLESELRGIVLSLLRPSSGESTRPVAQGRSAPDTLTRRVLRGPPSCT